MAEQQVRLQTPWWQLCGNIIVDSRAEHAADACRASWGWRQAGHVVDALAHKVLARLGAGGAR